MNGFTMLSDSYRLLAKKGEITKEMAEKKTRIYDFLANCSQEDFCNLVDSSAFNDIIISYLQLAIKGAGLNEEQQGRVLEELRHLFNERSAAKVMGLE